MSGIVLRPSLFALKPAPLSWHLSCSTRGITDSTQNITDTQVYDAFGNSVSRTGTTPTPFGFVGSGQYQTDGDSGLQLLGHRYYDPSVGHFLSSDPAQAGTNWYAYCENNPLRLTDPEGLDTIDYDGHKYHHHYNDADTQKGSPHWDREGGRGEFIGNDGYYYPKVKAKNPKKIKDKKALKQIEEMKQDYRDRGIPIILPRGSPDAGKGGSDGGGPPRI